MQSKLSHFKAANVSEIDFRFCRHFYWVFAIFYTIWAHIFLQNHQYCSIQPNSHSQAFKYNDQPIVFTLQKLTKSDKAHLPTDRRYSCRQLCVPSTFSFYYAVSINYRHNFSHLIFHSLKRFLFTYLCNRYNTGTY